MAVRDWQIFHVSSTAGQSVNNAKKEKELILRLTINQKIMKVNQAKREQKFSRK